MKIRALAVSLALLAGLFVTKRAHADNSVEVFLTVQAPDPKDPKQAGKAPTIEATIVGGQKTTVDKFSLSTTNQNQKVVIKADRLVSYDLVMAVTNAALERGISSVALATTPQH